MTVTKEHYIVGLLGIGAVIVLYMLLKDSGGDNASTATGEPIPVPVNQPTYPNAQPIQLGDVTINEGIAPSEQTYNTPLDGDQPDRVQIGNDHSECGCDDSDCETAGLPVTVQTVPHSVMSAAAKNLSTFTAKVTSGVQAARVSFGTVTKAGSGGGNFSAV